MIGRSRTGCRIAVLSSVPHSSFALRLAIFYAALFLTLGVQLPFLPLWLAAKGLDAGAIGIVLSVPMVVRVAAIPLATRSADRHDALRAAMVIASALALIGYAAMGLVQRVAKEMMVERSCDSMFTGATPYIDLKRMMLRQSSAANG